MDNHMHQMDSGADPLVCCRPPGRLFRIFLLRRGESESLTALIQRDTSSPPTSPSLDIQSTTISHLASSRQSAQESPILGRNTTALRTGFRRNGSPLGRSSNGSILFTAAKHRPHGRRGTLVQRSDSQTLRFACVCGHAESRSFASDGARTSAQADTIAKRHYLKAGQCDAGINRKPILAGRELRSRGAPGAGISEHSKVHRTESGASGFGSPSRRISLVRLGRGDLGVARGPGGPPHLAPVHQIDIAIRQSLSCEFYNLCGTTLERERSVKLSQFLRVYL
jgi:hypothetical protein